jgi:hypothetical protein
MQFKEQPFSFTGEKEERLSGKTDMVIGRILNNATFGVMNSMSE